MPDLVTAKNGEPFIFWSRFEGERRTIYYTTRQGQSWQKAQTVEAITEGAADEPRGILDHNGNIVLVWARFDGQNWNLWYSNFTGTSWREERLVGLLPGDHNQHQLALTKDARAYDLAAETRGRGKAVVQPLLLRLSARLSFRAMPSF